jgi:hypothetical protein
MFELRCNSNQNPLSKVGQRAKQNFEDFSRDFSIMLSSELAEWVGAVEGIGITVPVIYLRARLTGSNRQNSGSLDDER